MVTKPFMTFTTQAELDAYVAAQRNAGSGALWLSSKEAKSDLHGHFFDEHGVQHDMWLYATGSDGTQKGRNGGTLPLYNVSHCVHVDKPADDKS